MNTIATFRKCTLTDKQLLKKVDKMTDEIYTKYRSRDKFPDILIRQIPARPNDDYDLLIGEMILRFQELITRSRE